jgi:Zn-dependent protease with chaperone function
MNGKLNNYLISRWFLALIFSIYITNIYAQRVQQADTMGAAYAKVLTKEYALHNEVFLANLKNETDDKKLLKYCQTNFKDVFEALHERIKDRQMANIPEATAALEKMVTEIQSFNTEVPKDIRIILVRDNIPNAFTLGDNTLFVNIGLFYYLQNEDEIAGVLAHEIGHLLSKHSIKSLKYSFQKDSESALDLKSILNNKYKKADIALNTLKDILYSGGKNARLFEMQADSIGYLLLKNTHFHPQAFTDALSTTDRYDTIRPDGLLIETYKRFFDLPNQTFKEAWMRKEDFTLYNYNAFTEKLDKDSMLSHPTGKQRVEHLEQIFPELKLKNAAKAPTETYKRIKKIAEMERIPNLYVQEMYGEAVYLSLLYLQEQPNDHFYREWLGKSFNKVYEARKEYKLNKYLDQISPKDQSESYIQFLSFMWNLKLDELKNIAEFYNSYQ